jgi:zinc transport system substrate-binding protein
MIRKTAILLLMILFGSGLGLPQALKAADAVKPLQVVCTILPIYGMTLNVVGKIPGIEVTLLLSAHQGCPHNYDLTPGDLMKLSRARIILANGLGMEEFLEPLIKQGRVKAPIIQAAEKIPPIRNKPDPAPIGRPKAKADHDHGEEVNGHAWVSPKAAAIMTLTIAEGLALKDPAHAREFWLNAQGYAKKLDALAADMQEVVSKARNKKILAFHDSLAYLARDTGLSIAGVIESQLGVEPSPREMVRLVKVIRDQKIVAIFSEPQSSDKVARTLSLETGVPLFPFDIVATGQPTADTYEKAMRRNLDVLRRALK